MFNAIRTWFAFLSSPLLRKGERNKNSVAFSFEKSFMILVVGGVSALCLGGCGTTHHDVSVAPLSVASSPSDVIEHSVVVPPVVPVERALHAQNNSAPVVDALSYKNSAREEKPKNCSVKDRIDRDALIAYEWSRNRLSMDVDGIGGGDMGMMMTYKIRLQPEKTKKQKCRYNSSWQGMIGSGYNELMIREDDTLQEHFGKMRREFFDHLNNSF